MIFDWGLNLVSFIAMICPDPLVFSISGQFFSLYLSYSWHFWRVQSSYVVEYFSIWVWCFLMNQFAFSTFVSHATDLILYCFQCLISGGTWHDNVPFQVVITWLKWCLPGIFKEKLLLWYSFREETWNRNRERGGEGAHTSCIPFQSLVFSIFPM